MSRRSPGEGSISRRKDGRWQASLQVNGQRTTVYGKTRGEAAAKLRVLQSQAPAPTVNLTLSKRTLNELLDAWLDTKAAQVKPRTLADYRQTCNRYIRPGLGNMRLAKLTPDRIEGFLAGFYSHPRTAQKIHCRLSQALDLAVRWNWLGSNPCARVEKPRYRPEPKEIWTPEQLRRFVEGTREHWLHPFWVLAASTGARIGELLALTWGDVDLDGGNMSVGRSVQIIDGERVVGTPKTQAGIRCIGLPSPTVSVLRAWRARQAEQRLGLGDQWRAGEHLFSSLQGEPLGASTVHYALARACDRLGLPRISPHGLRHLHASLLLSQGVPIPAVSQRLGHANSGITLAVYAHALPKTDTQATEAISQVMNGTDVQVRS